ncbi:MAG: YrhA family protein [Clostridium butyricum]|uniref:YrhA family protein n=1 Tax=Clostridium TaxID=1485 RepID=UPI0011DE502C|nr:MULTISPECIES: YrhA family protein [Clostridium]MDB2139289.1 YrhA family protein [Clostridium butyricum]MDI9208314.1 YrhA family protein [Clostridium butyricum]MDU1116541.1 YrhA family protein [Clostridium sp.]MDU7712543.1 YrhA family protein [Clostridium butyricum]
MKIEKEWVKYIAEINIICKKYNETVNRNIASEVSIDTLKKWVFDNISKDLWLNDYEEFLKVQNGFKFEGLIFYGASDYESNLISENEAWDFNGESFGHKYLFLGDADISWYVYDICEMSFAELDKPSGDSIERFKDFDCMLLSALKTKIQI